MNKDLLNILSNSNKEIDNQQLMDYLSGRLSGPEKHDVEMSMADSDFMNDAVEGLQTVNQQNDIHTYVEQLNKDLRKKLRKKKGRREKRRLKEGPWGYVAILVIILLCIAGFFLVRKALLYFH
ncbi:hypothetical protein ACX0G9_03815 [Flavitalea flava]